MPRVQVNFYLYAKDVDRAAQFYQQHFEFKLEGQINPGEKMEMAAMRTDNAILWLGPQGTQKGLIILVESELQKHVERLKSKGVPIFLPDEFKKEQQQETQLMIETDWGLHSWMLDSENNVVMLFEPFAG